MSGHWLHYLNALDVDALGITDDETLSAVEGAPDARGRNETVIEPRVHIVPETSEKGHFNVLRGFVGRLDTVVGDFVDNNKRGLPSELPVLNLFDPETGAPRAIIDANTITDMRTGAVTGIGAKHLARKDSRIPGHVGARGTSNWNARLLNHLFDFDVIRVHSRRPESREAFAARLEKDLGKKIVVTHNWRDGLEGADIMVEATRLPAPEPKFLTEWVSKGAFVIPYGIMSAVEFDLTDIVDKIVVDDWGQCGPGRPFGSLRRHVDEGRTDPAHAACRDRPDRLWRKARTGTRRRNRSVLAPRPQHHRYRSRPPHGRQGPAAGTWPAPPVPVTGR